MKIKPYVDKLNSSAAYRDFQKKYEDAFMVAGFFILDLEQGQNIHQIDYYVPSEKKIAAFTLDHGVTMQMLDMMHAKIVPEKLDIKTKIDLDALHGILEDEMKNRSITEDIKKIIAIIQTVEGKKIWNLNCILSGMGILKAHIDDESQTVLKMEKSSVMDYIKKLPAGAMQQMKAQQKQGEVKIGEKKEESEGELKQKIKTLTKIEQEIEKEKEKIEDELEKKEKKTKKENKE